MIKCRRAILEYAEAKIIIVDMGYGPVFSAFDLVVKDKLVQDTARINKISSFVKQMCQVADLDHFDELIQYLKGIGYKVKSQEEQITVKPNEGIPN